MRSRRGSASRGFRSGALEALSFRPMARACDGLRRSATGCKDLLSTGCGGLGGGNLQKSISLGDPLGALRAWFSSYRGSFRVPFTGISSRCCSAVGRREVLFTSVHCAVVKVVNFCVPFFVHPSSKCQDYLLQLGRSQNGLGRRKSWTQSSFQRLLRTQKTLSGKKNWWRIPSLLPEQSLCCPSGLCTVSF